MVLCPLSIRVVTRSILPIFFSVGEYTFYPGTSRKVNGTLLYDVIPLGAQPNGALPQVNIRRSLQGPLRFRADLGLSRIGFRPTGDRAVSAPARPGIEAYRLPPDLGLSRLGFHPTWD